jgi:HPt (histidine-containing phosphotransfer) domain-containing protein
MDTQKFEPLKSTYANDQAIADILPLFLNNMPKYVGDLDSHIEHRDWAGAARVCHDLKGTAGGYGYPDIVRATQRLESELKQGQDFELIMTYLNDVRTLCERARASE